VFRVTPEEFDAFLDAALDTIPEEFLAALDNVVVDVADRNPDRPSLRGLYTGVPLTKRGQAYRGHLPDHITIYREPIMATSADRIELAAAIRTVVIHELAHHFGISDTRLHELGY